MQLILKYDSKNILIENTGGWGWGGRGCGGGGGGVGGGAVGVGVPNTQVKSQHWT